MAILLHPIITTSFSFIVTPTTKQKYNTIHMVYLMDFYRGVTLVGVASLAYLV